jgi:hypothetical protein
MSRKVNEASSFTKKLREINANRMAAFEAKPKLMMSDMELKLQEVDDEAERLEAESMSKEERRKAKVESKLVRGVTKKSDLTGNDQLSAVEGVAHARRAGAVNLDLAIEEYRSTSPVFSWRPMARVTLATELPLELFEDEDEELAQANLFAVGRCRLNQVDP